jgi:hypothetical protein
MSSVFCVSTLLLLKLSDETIGECPVMSHRASRVRILTARQPGLKAGSRALRGGMVLCLGRGLVCEGL